MESSRAKRKTGNLWSGFCKESACRIDCRIMVEVKRAPVAGALFTAEGECEKRKQLQAHRSRSTVLRLLRSGKVGFHVAPQQLLWISDRYGLIFLNINSGRQEVRRMRLSEAILLG